MKLRECLPSMQASLAYRSMWFYCTKHCTQSSKTVCKILRTSQTGMCLPRKARAGLCSESWLESGVGVDAAAFVARETKATVLRGRDSGAVTVL